MNCRGGPNHGPRRLVGAHGAGVRGGPRELTLRQTAASIRAASIHLALDAYRVRVVRLHVTVIKRPEGGCNDEEGMQARSPGRLRIRFPER